MTHDRDRVLVIAEAGVNHNGDVERALDMIDAASEAKADVVKFQTFNASRLVTRHAAKAAYQKKALADDADGTQHGMLKKLELPEEAYARLVERCRARGVEFLSTPFDEPSVDLLRSHGMVRMKIGSGDVATAPLLLRAARTKLPLILSTGASTLADVEQALGVLAFGFTAPAGRAPKSESDFAIAYGSPEGRAALEQSVTILHCVTEYPAPVRDVNLRAMDTLRDAFGLPVGYSDHTMGITLPIAAVARGATVIEKHFTLDRALPGPDHAASLTPSELATMIAAIRDVSAALGSPRKCPAPSELANRVIVRRSVVAARPIKKGEVLSTENLTVKRPAGGRSPYGLWELLGRAAEKDYEVDDPV